MHYLFKRWASNSFSAVGRVTPAGTPQAFRLPFFRSVPSRAWVGEYIDAVANNGDVRNSFSHPSDRVLCEGPVLAINDRAGEKERSASLMADVRPRPDSPVSAAPTDDSKDMVGERRPRVAARAWEDGQARISSSRACSRAPTSQ